MRTFRAAIACLLAAACGLARAAEAPPKPEEIVVVIFPFGSPDGDKTGLTFAERLRLRARRLNLVVVERLSLNEAMAGKKMPTLDTPPAEMATILAGRFGAKIGLWGEVRPEGAGFAMTFRGLNLNLDKDKLTISDTRRAAEPQLVNPVQDQVLLELTGRSKKPVPTATPEADAKAPTRGPELVANGGFETGTASPDGWQRLDGLTTFWSDGGASGKCLKINTDVYHDEWVAWQKKYKAGAKADDAPNPTPTSGPKYDTVAGIYGVAYDSAPIPVTPGKAYKVSIDYRGKSTDFFFPKLFIRGWADVAGEKRVVYDAYLALRCATDGKQWESNVRICEIPTLAQSKIEYVVLKVYAYWPPGTFYFDNVSMKEVAR
ncbi:MAG: hypothetical protein AMS14_03525 [Planctomycetes bacterium DG_20]|nr:MAG: hypothetical protein AMS14_03525 [Planctomycetes bacterium DG_20]